MQLGRIVNRVAAAGLLLGALLSLPAAQALAATSSVPGANLVETVNPDWVKTGWWPNAINDTISTTATTFSTFPFANIQFNAESTAVLPTTGFRVITGFLKAWAPAPVDTAGWVVLDVQVRAHPTQSADSSNTFPLTDWQVSGGLYDSTGTVFPSLPSVGNGTERRVYIPAAWCMPGNASGAPLKRIWGDNGLTVTVQSRGGTFAAPFISIRVRVQSSGSTAVLKTPRVLMHIYGAR